MPAPPLDHRILIIDDEPALCHVLQRALSRDYRTVVALTSAREALLLLSEGRRFDVILCDFFMPEMTGAELHARLDPSLRDRLVFLTGGALTTRAQEFLATTPNPCIIKPFSMTVVSAIVKKVLAQRANAITEPPPPLRRATASAR